MAATNKMVAWTSMSKDATSPNTARGGWGNNSRVPLLPHPHPGSVLNYKVHSQPRLLSTHESQCSKEISLIAQAQFPARFKTRNHGKLQTNQIRRDTPPYLIFTHAIKQIQPGMNCGEK